MARTITTGGRQGIGRSLDNAALNVSLRLPKDMGGLGDGTNPEQLFGVGYSACFLGAMGVMAREMSVKLAEDLKIEADTTLGRDEASKLLLAIRFHIKASMDQQQLENIVHKAHETIEPTVMDDLTTSETLQSEPWDLFLEISDRLAATPNDIRPFMSALAQRLCHRSTRVQILTLSLLSSLSANVGLPLQKEVATRTFTELLARMIRERATNFLVRQKIVDLFLDFEREYQDRDLGLMRHVCQTLRSEGFLTKFEPPSSSDLARQEEEDVERAMRMSVAQVAPIQSNVELEEVRLREERERLEHEHWLQHGYGPAPGVGITQDVMGHAQASTSQFVGNMSGESSQGNLNVSQHMTGLAVSQNQGSRPVGFVARADGVMPGAYPQYETSSYATSLPLPPTGSTQATQAGRSHQSGQMNPVVRPDHVRAGSSSQGVSGQSSANLAAPLPQYSSGSSNPIQYVKALFDFQPLERGEIALKKDDIVTVLDSSDQDWYFGKLGANVGVFPKNYCQIVDPPTTSDRTEELERILSRQGDVQELLRLLQSATPQDFLDNTELQRLYASVVQLRPQISSLYNTYSQKLEQLKTLAANVEEASRLVSR